MFMVVCLKPLKTQNEPKLRLIFVKRIGKFWEVADFRDFVTNGKVV